MLTKILQSRAYNRRWNRYSAFSGITRQQWATTSKKTWYHFQHVQLNRIFRTVSVTLYQSPLFASHRNRTWGTCNLVVSMPLQWYCQIGFCCDFMLKYVLKVSTFSDDATPCVYTGPDHLTQSTRSEVHIPLPYRKYTRFKSLPRAPLPPN